MELALAHASASYWNMEYFPSFLCSLLLSGVYFPPLQPDPQPNRVLNCLEMTPNEALALYSDSVCVRVCVFARQFEPAIISAGLWQSQHTTCWYSYMNLTNHLHGVIETLLWRFIWHLLYLHVWDLFIFAV